MTKRYLTGLKPTGKQLHIGNYFGSIKQMIELSKENPDAEFFLFLANMHGFTQIHDKTEMKENSMMALKLYLACGVDTKQFKIYNPADIAGHAQLNWVLTCITHM
jgi:tryptophanyl-tRNA synthetase